jgi:LCP family protein required for cell wall assembly
MLKWKTISIYLLFFFLVIVVAYINGFYSHYKDTLAKIHITDETTPSTSPEDSKIQKPFALLLFGLEKTGGSHDPGRTDTILLAFIDPKRQKVQLISIPRDSYVNIPGYRKDKINAGYTKGGAPLLKKTLENWLDIDIADYVYINFQGFIDLVNVVGGLDIHVPRNMNYDDPVDGTHIHLKKGQQHLDGKQALDFVRFRKSNNGNAVSDYDRIERQQTALKNLGSKLISMKALSNYHDIFNILSDNMRTTLTEEDINFLIRRFYSFDINNLQMTTIIGEGVYVNNCWYEQIPEKEMKRIGELINQFIERAPN